MQLFVLSLLQSHESGDFLSRSILNIDQMLSHAMLSTLVAIQWDLYAMIIPTSVVFSISLFSEIYTDGQDLDQRMFLDYACKLQSSKSLTGMQYGMVTNHKPSEVSLQWSQFRIGPTSLVVPRHHANPTRCRPGIGFFLKCHTRPGVKISDPFHPYPTLHPLVQPVVESVKTPSLYSLQTGWSTGCGWATQYAYRALASYPCTDPQAIAVDP